MVPTAKRNKIEEKESAPSSSSSSSSTSDLPSTFRDLVRLHLEEHMQPGPARPIHSLLHLICESSFRDFLLCQFAVRAAERASFPQGATQHDRLVLRDPIEPTLVTCLRCPANPRSSILCSPLPLSLGEKEDAHVLERIRRARSAWELAKTELAKAAAQVGQPMNPSILHGEQTAWMDYCMAAWEDLRSYLVRSFCRQLEGQPKLPMQGAFMLQAIEFRRAWRTRQGVPQQGGHEIMCPRHKQVGHFFPHEGFRAYRADCWICPVPVVRDTNPLDPARNARISEAELAELTRPAAAPAKKKEEEGPAAMEM